MKIHFTSRRMVKVLHICREMHDDRVSAKLSVCMGIYTFNAAAAVAAAGCMRLWRKLNANEKENAI